MEYVLFAAVFVVIGLLRRRRDLPVAAISFDEAVPAQCCEDKGIPWCTCGEHRHDPSSGWHQPGCSAYEPGR